MTVNNPNIVIRQPQHTAYNMFVVDYLTDQLEEKKRILEDRLEIVKMSLELYKIDTEFQLEELDNQISELKELLKDV